MSRKRISRKKGAERGTTQAPQQTVAAIALLSLLANVGLLAARRFHETAKDRVTI
jgi:hypothetical protein